MAVLKVVGKPSCESRGTRIFRNMDVTFRTLDNIMDASGCGSLNNLQGFKNKASSIAEKQRLYSIHMGKIIMILSQNGTYFCEI